MFRGIICSFGVFVAVSVSAQAPSIETRFDEIFAPWNRADSAGAVVGVVKDGALVFAKGYGMHDVAAGRRLTPESRMNLGSTSKQFAAAAIVLLAQDGKLSLDDDVRKHLPEIQNYGAPITIRHLIHHTSGIRDYLVLRNLAGLSDDTAFGNPEVLELIVKQRELNFEPGAEHLYSNSGYALLAIVVERVSGMTLTEFARVRIFEPLGMTSTCWDTDLSKYRDERALSYPTRGTGIPPANRQDTVEGDGNVMTTVGDLAKWDANFYTPVVGGRAFIAQMLERGTLNDGTALDYAFGLEHGAMFGRPIVQHGGAWLGFRAQFTRFPEDRLSVIVLGNLAGINPDALVEKVARVYLGISDDVPARAGVANAVALDPLDLPKRELRAKVGKYFAEDSGVLYKVEMDGDALLIDADGRKAGLTAIGAARFALADEPRTAEFVFDTDGKEEPKSLTVKRPNGSETIARRVDPNVQIPALDAFAGTYHSDEVGADFAVDFRDGSLFVMRPATKEQPLEHVCGDWFTRGIKYHFERNVNGAVTGFRVSLGRVRNIRFEKRS